MKIGPNLRPFLIAIKLELIYIGIQQTFIYFC